jgi:hypothetical protein
MGRQIEGGAAWALMVLGCAILGGVGAAALFSGPGQADFIGLHAVNAALLAAVPAGVWRRRTTGAGQPLRQAVLTLAGVILIASVASAVALEDWALQLGDFSGPTQHTVAGGIVTFGIALFRAPMVLALGAAEWPLWALAGLILPLPLVWRQAGRGN